jgi:rhodanese-related sulfurtransferase
MIYVIALFFVALIALVLWWWQARPCAGGDLTTARAWVAQRYPDQPRISCASWAVLSSASGQLLVDVRSAAEWRVAHLPGAWRCEDPQNVLAEAQRRGANRIIVYCSVGVRSSRLAATLRLSAVQTELVDLDGGIFTWATLGLPLVDADGAAVTRVHPYDQCWGRLLPDGLRSDFQP